jgi:hypothetical protein
MARVKVHALCLRPLRECDCPDDDEPELDGDDGEDDCGDDAA